MSLHLLEWSHRQGLFHIQPLRTALAKNQASFASNAKTDYIPILMGSHEDCSKMAEQLRPILKKREGVEA